VCHKRKDHSEKEEQRAPNIGRAKPDFHQHIVNLAPLSQAHMFVFSFNGFCEKLSWKFSIKRVPPADFLSPSHTFRWPTNTLSVSLGRHFPSNMRYATFIRTIPFPSINFLQLL
jgi:hypothetical protein